MNFDILIGFKTFKFVLNFKILYVKMLYC